MLDNPSYIMDTFFAIFAMVLIIFMVPGFAMLEAGLVRTKNVTAVLTMNVMIYAVASMSFMLIGYEYAFFLFQMAIVFPISFVVIFIINKIFQLTADEEEQLIGIDEAECGMLAYPEFRRTI